MKLASFNRLCEVLALVVLLSTSALAATEAINRAKEQDLIEGERIFATVCFLCHGTRGRGDGAAAMFIGPYMHPRPNNFTLGSIKFRSTGSGDLPTLPDLMRTIRSGIPGFMPSFKYLKKDGIRQVALFIATEFIEKSIEEKLPLETDIVFTNAPYTASQRRRTRARKPSAPLVTPVEAARRTRSIPVSSASTFYGKGGSRDLLSALSYQEKGSPPDAVYATVPSRLLEHRKPKAPKTEKRLKVANLLDPSGLIQPIRSKREQLLRGQKLFRAYACIACHGMDGNGSRAKTSFKDERGLPVKAADLTRPETLGNGSRPEDIYRTIMTGLNGTPMPSFSGLFVGEEEKVWDLVHYIRSLGGLEP